jgi:TrmH family RNA methyltransferase
MTLISSRDNSVIKDYVRLCSAKSVRDSSGRFTIEGARLCHDALGSGLRIESVFLTRGACEKYADVTAQLLSCSAQVYEITQAVAEKMADTQNPQGIFCEAYMLDKTLNMDRIDMSGAYIVIENLQDPGNLGTVLRTAEALGLDGVFLSSDCADIYSPKVLRSAMGAVFRIPFLITDELPYLLHTLSQKGVKTVAAVAEKGALSILEAELGGGIAAVIGNEGAGLTPACVAACTQCVTIPMGGRSQSLNAGAAASILIWEIYKSRR